MARLSLSLLGTFQVMLDEEPVTAFETDKGRALLAYLALESEQPHRRERLAGLLWPERPERRARRNLSQTLFSLRKTIVDRKARRPFLLITPQTLQFNRASEHYLDVTEFRSLLVTCQNHRHRHLAACEECLVRLRQAVALYRGSFLAGLSLAGSPSFEEWALLERERFQRLLVKILRDLVDSYEQRAEYDLALRYARQWIELEPWQEEGHRQLMRLLTLDGQRGLALAQYETCRRTLAEELEVEPEPETTALYERIHAGLALPAALPLLTDRKPAEAVRSPSSPDLSPAPLEGERRQVTVVRAKVTGSTSVLEQAGTEVWAELMNHLLQRLGAEIIRFGGEVDVRSSEGLVAIFSATRAHEDDPERAVLAALAMQTALNRYVAELAQGEGIDTGPPLALGLWVGINTGEAIVTSSPRIYEHTAMGKASAVVDRMETLAESGTVLVSQNTRNLIEPLFEWEPAGEIRVKGMRRPVALYRPLVHKALVVKPRGIAGLESPLVGRQAEFRILVEAAERLQSGLGGIVTIVGEAGLGKSRLVAELRYWTLQAQSLTWAESRCLSYSTATAYHLWLDILRGVLGVSAESSPVAGQETLREQVQTICPDHFDDVYSYLASMISFPLAAEVETTLRGLGPEGLKTCTFRAVETLLEQTARRRPLIIVCEDLHWADPTSVELLERLLSLTERAPLLFICVFRPETDRACWRIKEAAARLFRHRHTDVWLKPLSPPESETLLRSLLGVSDTPRVLEEHLLNRAEGNPFFIEEIIRSLIDAEVIARDEATARWQVRREVADIVLPDTLHGVLMSRIDRLPDEARRVLQRASVIGRLFSNRLLAEIAPDHKDRLEEQLLLLQRMQLIREQTRLPKLEYIFKHHLTQEAAYSSLLQKERRLFHRQVAEALERLFPDRLEQQLGLLAYHWEQAEAPEQALLYLLRAGKQTRLAYSNEEAMDYLKRALELLDGSALGDFRKEWRLEAQQGLGQVYFATGKLAEAAACFREAIALGQEMGLSLPELIRLYHWLGTTLWWQGRYDDQIRLGEAGLALLGEDPESAEAALMYQTAAAGYEMKGNVQKWREIFSRVAQFIQHVPYAEELRSAYGHLVDMCVKSKNVEAARQWLQILEEKAAPHHDLRALGMAHYYTGWTLLQTGDLHQAGLYLQQALDLLVRIGDTKHEAWCLLRLVENCLALGDLQKAEEYVTDALHAVEAVGNKLSTGWLYDDIGQLSLCQRDLKRAEDAFQKCVSLGQELPYPPGEAHAAYLWGRAFLAQGDCDAGLEQFRACLSLIRPEGIEEYRLAFPFALGGLESTYDDPAAFRAFCRRYREEHPELRHSSFVQWYLEPAGIRECDQTVHFEDEFSPTLAPGWKWQDEFGDCSCSVQNGLKIHAATGRDLWHINLSAPRLLRPTAGEFAAQTVCEPVSDGRPAIGGLHLWQDRENFLRFDQGAGGEHEIFFGGCVDNMDVIVGRGLLPPDPQGRIFLRLERIGSRVDAFCSADGKNWFTVGQVAFPGQGSVQIGLHAIGYIDRAIYHEAYPDGTAIRFESFQLWKMREPQVHSRAT